MSYELGTNDIPKALEDKLTEAKTWYDSEPPAATGTRAALEREDWDRQAISILTDIVEAVDKTWGFA
jgi:hypothetical protein